MATEDYAMRFFCATTLATMRDVEWANLGTNDGLLRDYAALNRDSDPETIHVKLLPKLGKWYDKCLSSSGKDEWGEPPLTVARREIDGSQSTRIPFVDEIHGGSFLSVNVDDVSHEQVAAVRQLLYMFKRWAAPCPPIAVVQAVREFWDIDQGLRTPRSIDTDLTFHVCGGLFQDALTGDEDSQLWTLVRTMDALAKRMQPTSWVDVADIVPRHGPGAVSDLRSGGDKYTFPSYPSVIDEAMPAAYFCNHAWGRGEDVGICSQKMAAKLVAVPKTMEKPRLIASEPVVHQFLQQGLMKWIRTNMCGLHKVMIDFTSQEPNQQYALRASRWGHLATVDLSSASDRLSMWAVESMFSHSPDFLDLLLRTRSSHIKDSIYLGEVREIKKFAPMGSAVTFPVQSLIYATAALAASLVADGKVEGRYEWRNRTLYRIAQKIRVFGDDIILPKAAVPNLVRLLEFLELKVNLDKTHVSGHFRESCGMDAYRGYSVTPAYISQVAPTSPGTSLEAYVEQSNNAHKAGLWNLAYEMLLLIPSAMRGLVPVSSRDLGCTALFTYTPGTQASKVRYNRRLQRYEVKGIVPKPASREGRDSWMSLLQYFLEEPSPDSNWASGFVHKLRPKYRAWWVDARTDWSSQGTET